MPYRPNPAQPPKQSFDRTTWNQLSSLDIRILDELAFLSRSTATRSATGARYCYPSRPWLAQRLACSVETITRHTSKLARLGLLAKLQRRPVRGTWQTNLYRLIHPMAWAAARLRANIVRLSNRLSRMPGLASSQSRRVIDRTRKEGLAEIIARGMAKWGPA